MAYHIYDDVNIRTTVPKYEEIERKAEDGSVIVLKPFAMRMSLDAQLALFVKMRVTDPARAKEIYELNEYVLQLAGQGSMRKLTAVVEGVGDASHLLTYYMVKAFKAAILGGHFMVVNYFIDKGYPFQTAKVPHVLLEILAQTSSAHAASVAAASRAGHSNNNKSTISEETCYALVEFLILKNRGINAESTGAVTVTGTEECEIVNLAAKGNYLTPLHVAIRYGLFTIIDLLLSNGADVNAVGDGDAMPLPLAYRLRDAHQEDMFAREHDASAVQGERVSELDVTANDVAEDASAVRRRLDLEKADRIDLLIRALHMHGARLTWRKGGTSGTVTSTSTGPSTSTGTGAEYNVYKTSITESVFRTATTGAGSDAHVAAAPAPPRRKMVGFSGTVSKDTTPTVEQTLAALGLGGKASAATAAASAPASATGSAKKTSSGPKVAFGSTSSSMSIGGDNSIASSVTTSQSSRSSKGSAVVVRGTHGSAMGASDDPASAEVGTVGDPSGDWSGPAVAYEADDGAQIFSTGM